MRTWQRKFHYLLCQFRDIISEEYLYPLKKGNGFHKIFDEDNFTQGVSHSATPSLMAKKLLNQFLKK